MFDTLLPIPDEEYPAFYPIGIKVSCVCVHISYLLVSWVDLDCVSGNSGNVTPIYVNLSGSKFALAFSGPSETLLQREARLRLFSGQKARWSGKQGRFKVGTDGC
jgi:hypothetical protein